MFQISFPLFEFSVFHGCGKFPRAHQLQNDTSGCSERQFNLLDRFIKDELKTMQAFLAAAEATKNRDMLLKVWAEQ
uniref:Uncharacterized protein n=1 Tax=Triticum urartu TaxID=4572 RepID=A0A8R7QZI3_TRIUA